jgi:hypothetical protein
MSEFVHTVTLPSAGLYYDGAIPGGTVQVKEITGREEAILYGDGSFENRVDALVNACTILPTPEDGGKAFDPMNLLDTDRFFLLLQIRKHTFGSTYEFDYRCPQCDEQQTLRFNIDDLGINNPPADAQSEPVSVELTSAGITVGYKFLRGKDIRRLTQMAEQAKLRGQKNQLYPYRYTMMLVTVDGRELEWAAKYDLIQGLHGRDTAVLREHIRAHESGPQTRTDVRCGACGFWNKSVALPLNTEFFRLEP